MYAAHEPRARTRACVCGCVRCVNDRCQHCRTPMNRALRDARMVRRDAMRGRAAARGFCAQSGRPLPRRDGSSTCARSSKARAERTRAHLRLARLESRQLLERVAPDRRARRLGGERERLFLELVQPERLHRGSTVHEGGQWRRREKGGGASLHARPFRARAICICISSAHNNPTRQK